MTRKLFLIAGVAGIALAAPANAERGGNHDREAREHSGNEQKAQRPQRAERQQMQRAERPQRIERQQMQRAERPQRAERQQMQRAERPQRIERQQAQRAERQQRIERQQLQRAERQQRLERQQLQRAERQHRLERQQVQRAERQQRDELQQIRQAERQQRIDRQQARRVERPQRVERQRADRIQRQAERIDRRRELAIASDVNLDSRREARREERRFRSAGEASRRFARFESNRDMRPMKVDEDRRIVDVGDRIDPVRFSSFVPTIYRARYVDTPDYRYRYDDDRGYLYRIDRDDNIVRAMIPLYGGYGIGDPWPMTYYSSYVPLGYRDYYYDTPDYYYRNDGYGIYQVDAGTQLITALVALLTGQGFGIGQMLPASYSAYNVPLAYRSTYYDRDDAWYRYGDGFIYQVDPYTRRIAERYPIYADSYDYMIGQPWPVAYPGYNVPYGYQQLYYDTPQYHYRYANGGIYQVDPTTQVIMALVALVTGQQFAVGQPMPAAYNAYNMPFAYRDRYVDTGDEWYRYADGYVYRIDADSGLIEDAIPVYA